MEKQQLSRDLKDKSVGKRWFETKFNWFISSENVLCLQGKDFVTQDILVKRYMSLGRFRKRQNVGEKEA